MPVKMSPVAAARVVSLLSHDLEFEYRKRRFLKNDVTELQSTLSPQTNAKEQMTMEIH